MQSIPLELYRSIFQYPETQDLASLSRVSSIFQLEAEDILYRHVDLHHRIMNDEQVMSWCRAIITVQRKAHCVNTLKFSAMLREAPTDESELKDIRQTIARAFNAIINLKHLFILSVADKRTSSLQPSTFRDCTFRLVSFGGQSSSFGLEDLWEFLSGHPDIEYWVPTKTFLKSVQSFPDHVLLRLRQTVIVEPSKTRLLRGRPVESLALVFATRVHARHVGLDTITSLKWIANTLHTLHYTHGQLPGNWSALDIIRCIAQHAPNLISLSIQGFSQTGPMTSVEDQQSLVDACAGFLRIEILALNTEMLALRTPNNQPPDASNPKEMDESWARHSLNPAQCRRVATTFMVACPRLKNLSIPFYARSGRDSEGCLTYVRSGTDANTARFDGFYSVNTSGWWMR